MPACRLDKTKLLRLPQELATLATSKSQGCCCAECGYQRSVTSADTCDSFARSYDLTLDQLSQLNPGVVCSALPLGYTLCLGNGALPAQLPLPPSPQIGLIAADVQPA